MKKSNRLRLLVGMVLIMNIMRILTVNNGFIFSDRSTKPVPGSNIVYDISKDISAIELYQENRRIQVHHSGTVVPGLAKIKHLLSVLLFCYASLYVVIGICSIIKELNTIRFNGSKYKGGHLLPEV